MAWSSLTCRGAYSIFLQIARIRYAAEFVHPTRWQLLLRLPDAAAKDGSTRYARTQATALGASS
jgi:hypothetical protein